MLLLLIVDSDLTDGLFQTDGDLVVVRDALTCRLIVFIEAHLMIVDDTIHVMPRSVGCFLVMRLPFMFAV